MHHHASERPAPPASVQGVRTTIAAVVDRLLPPSACNITAPGVGVTNMTLLPARGGLIPLPVTEHMYVRHVVKALRAIVGMCRILPSNPPWLRLLLAVLHHILPATHTHPMPSTGIGDVLGTRQLRVLGGAFLNDCSVAVCLLSLAVLPPAKHLIPRLYLADADATCRCGETRFWSMWIIIC